MEENTQQTSVIGKHNGAGTKAQRTGAIALIICGALLVILGILMLVTVDDAATVAIVMFALGAIIAGLGIVFLVVANKHKAVDGTPAILLSQDNTTLTLMLGKDKQQTVQLADIKNIKFIARRSAQYLGIVTRYITHLDGTLVFYMKDGNKYKVPCVDQAEAVIELINSCKSKIQ